MVLVLEFSLVQTVYYFFSVVSDESMSTADYELLSLNYRICRFPEAHSLSKKRSEQWALVVVTLVTPASVGLIASGMK